MADALTAFVMLESWTDVSSWRANNLTTMRSAEIAPTSQASVIRLTEDKQNTWRSIQTTVQPERERSIKVTAEVKLDAIGRQAVLMVFADGERFACNLNPVTRRAATFTLGKATISNGIATPLGDKWWRIEMTGTLPAKSAKDPVFITIAITKDGFREDYLGDGRSSIAIGAVTIAQAAT